MTRILRALAAYDAGGALHLVKIPLTGLPLLLGVGVGTPEQATQVGAYADGAIVGSALMARLVDGDRAGFLDLVCRFRSALPAG